MNRGFHGYWIAAAVAAAIVLLLDRVVHPDTGRRNLEVFTEMVYSRAGEPFARNAALPGGRTQQPLAAGVVVRGDPLWEYTPDADGARRAGAELLSPVAEDDAAARETGRRLYSVYCSVCHDSRGDGQGPVVSRGMLPPPSLKASRALTLSDGELFHVLTYGQGNMASYAAQLSVEERWQVIAHVRSLQGE